MDKRNCTDENIKKQIEDAILRAKADSAERRVLDDDEDEIYAYDDDLVPNNDDDEVMMVLEDGMALRGRMVYEHELVSDYAKLSIMFN